MASGLGRRSGALLLCAARYRSWVVDLMAGWRSGCCVAGCSLTVWLAVGLVGRKAVRPPPKIQPTTLKTKNNGYTP